MKGAKDSYIEAIRKAARKAHAVGVIALMDPDVAGRQGAHPPHLPLRLPHPPG